MNFTFSVKTFDQSLIDRADDMDTMIHGIYLGFDGQLELPGDELSNLIGSPTTRETEWYPNASDPSGKGGYTVNRTVSLWQLTRTFASRMRVVGHSATVAASQLTQGVSNDVTRERQYLNNNDNVLNDKLTEARARVETNSALLPCFLAPLRLIYAGHHRSSVDTTQHNTHAQRNATPPDAQMLKLVKYDAKVYVEDVISTQIITAAALGGTFAVALLTYNKILDKARKYPRLQHPRTLPTHALSSVAQSFA